MFNLICHQLQIKFLGFIPYWGTFVWFPHFPCVGVLFLGTQVSIQCQKNVYLIIFVTSDSIN